MSNEPKEINGIGAAGLPGKCRDAKFSIVFNPNFGVSTMNAELREELARYRDLPDNGLAGVVAVMALTGWKRTTLWRKVRDGEFPKPRKLCRSLRWSKAEVDAFLAGVGKGEAENHVS